MNKYLIVLVLLLSFTTYSKDSGTGSSGGGLGYLTLSGKVNFKDLSPSPLLPKSLHKKLYKHYVYSESEKTTSLGNKDLHQDFLSCAIQRFEESNLLILNFLADYLQFYDVYKVSFPLEHLFPHLNYTNDSRFKIIATYAQKNIFVNQKLYNQMSSSHQCALAIHESLRILRDMGFAFIPDFNDKTGLLEKNSGMFNNQTLEYLTQQVYYGNFFNPNKKFNRKDWLYAKYLNDTTVLNALIKYAVDSMDPTGGILIGGNGEPIFLFVEGAKQAAILRRIQNYKEYKLRERYPESQQVKDMGNSILLAKFIDRDYRLLSKLNLLSGKLANGKSFIDRLSMQFNKNSILDQEIP